jgi:hypothetical protein
MAGLASVEPGWAEPGADDTPVYSSYRAGSRQSAGNLPDGSAFLVGNPSGNRDRYPMALLLSADGHRFDRAFLLRYAGRYKRAGYSYPKKVL